MISREMIARGYEAGLIRLISSPNEDGVVCSIEEGWFYFGGITAETETPESYEQAVDRKSIIDEIFSTLEGFYEDAEELKDEYLYYEAVLREHGFTEE